MSSWTSLLKRFIILRRYISNSILIFSLQRIMNNPEVEGEPDPTRPSLPTPSGDSDSGRQTCHWPVLRPPPANPGPDIPSPTAPAAPPEQVLQDVSSDHPRLPHLLGPTALALSQCTSLVCATLFCRKIPLVSVPSPFKKTS